MRSSGTYFLCACSLIKTGQLCHTIMDSIIGPIPDILRPKLSGQVAAINKMADVDLPFYKKMYEITSDTRIHAKIAADRISFRIVIASQCVLYDTVDLAMHGMMMHQDNKILIYFADIGLYGIFTNKQYASFEKFADGSIKPGMKEDGDYRHKLYQISIESSGRQLIIACRDVNQRDDFVERIEYAKAGNQGAPPKHDSLGKEIVRKVIEDLAVVISVETDDQMIDEWYKLHYLVAIREQKVPYQMKIPVRMKGVLAGKYYTLPPDTSSPLEDPFRFPEDKLDPVVEKNIKKEEARMQAQYRADAELLKKRNMDACAAKASADAPKMCAGTPVEKPKAVTEPPTKSTESSKMDQNAPVDGAKESVDTELRAEIRELRDEMRRGARENRELMESLIAIVSTKQESHASTFNIEKMTATIAVADGGSKITQRSGTSDNFTKMIAAKGANIAQKTNTSDNIVNAENSTVDQHADKTDVANGSTVDQRKNTSDISAAEGAVVEQVTTADNNAPIVKQKTNKAPRKTDAAKNAEVWVANNPPNDGEIIGKYHERYNDANPEWSMPSNKFGVVANKTLCAIGYVIINKTIDGVKSRLWKSPHQEEIPKC